MWSGILIKSCDRSPTYGMTRTNGCDQLSNRGHDAKLNSCHRYDGSAYSGCLGNNMLDNEDLFMWFEYFLDVKKSLGKFFFIKKYSLPFPL